MDVTKEYGLGPSEEPSPFERSEDAIIRNQGRTPSSRPIPHGVVDINVGPDGSVITAWSNLTTNICSETKIFFLLMVFAYRV
jgi:hypothetical protein